MRRSARKKHQSKNQNNLLHYILLDPRRVDIQVPQRGTRQKTGKTSGAFQSCSCAVHSLLHYRIARHVPSSGSGELIKERVDFIVVLFTETGYDSMRKSRSTAYFLIR